MTEETLMRLDGYNARWRNVKPYVPLQLVRISEHHPSAHLARRPERYAECGELVNWDWVKDGEDARYFCNKCKAWLEKRTQGMEVVNENG